MKNPLRAFREALGLSRNQLASAIGKSPQTLEKYEAEPPPEILHALKEYAASINRADAIALLDPNPAPSPASPAVLQSPDLLSGLGNVDIWHVQQLVNILRDRPQGRVFRLLANTLQKAAREYVSTKPGSSTAPPDTVINGRPKVEWLRIAAAVLDSSDPDLLNALSTNLLQFGKDAQALRRVQTEAKPATDPKRRSKAG